MIGTTLSHYEILDELGRGGMGVVYKARDTKLDRTVALKVLPLQALGSEDDRARFYREARAAAALSHANIGHVYEIDEVDGANGERQPFIAMEFIDGETLAVRIARGPIPLAEAVDIAAKVASALKAAHDKGIVHRDVKSGNVMLAKGGGVKILDFGLAKTSASTKLTQMGSTIGTAAYMSPEQSRGEEVDHRSDIWSLGVILYEMVAGRLPFGGDYDQAVLYGILNQDPPSLTEYRAGVPLALDRIIGKLLAKDPDLRYQHVDELPADLKALDLVSSGVSRISTRSAVAAAAAPGQDRERTDDLTPRVGPGGGWKPSLVQAIARTWPVLLVLTVIAASAGYFGASTGNQEPEQRPLRKLTLYMDGMRSLAYPAISPSSEWLAFSGVDVDGTGGIFLYEMATGDIRYIEGSATYQYASFSPDSRRLALLRFAGEGGVAVMVVPDGVPDPVSEHGVWHSWETDRLLLYSDDDPEYGLYRISIDRREPEFVAAMDTTLGWATAIYTQGRFEDSEVVIGGIQNTDASRHVLITLDRRTGQLQIGEAGIANAEPVPGGYLLYQVGGDLGRLVVRPFDAQTASFQGPPRSVLPEIQWGGFSVGQDGSLLYASESLLASANSGGLYIVDLDGEGVNNVRLFTSDIPDRPAFAPDGREIAVQMEPSGSGEVMVAVYDVEQGVLSQRTFDGRRRDPDWSADGRLLYYDDFSGGRSNVYRRASDGSGAEELVVDDASNPDLSADGRFLAFVREPGDVYVMDLASGDVMPIDTSAGLQLHPDISPSGRYVAYETEVTGPSRIEVREIRGEGRWLVADVEARRAHWSPDERYIYFRFPGQGISRVAVNTESGFRTVGEPTLVVTAPYTTEFDVSPDGTRLAVTGTSVSLSAPSAGVATIVWWQNWAQSLPEPEQF